MPLTILAQITANPGQEELVRGSLLSLIEPTLAEEGCLNYDLHVDNTNPGFFVFYENWESAQALQKHSQAPHMVEALGAAQDLLAEPPSITQLKRIG